MRILHLTDLHFRQRWLDWAHVVAANYDLVCISGDLLDMFAPTPLREQIPIVSEWLQSLPAKAAVCSGNHCWWENYKGRDADAEAKWLRRLRSRQLIVDGGSRMVDQHVRVSSAGWTDCYEPREAPLEIVVTHCGPRHVEVAQTDREDYGDELLLIRLRHRRAVVLSGHVHQPRRWCDFVWDRVMCINPGCDFDAQIPRHAIIDVDAGYAELVVGGAVADRAKLPEAKL